MYTSAPPPQLCITGQSILAAVNRTLFLQEAMFIWGRLSYHKSVVVAVRFFTGEVWTLCSLGLVSARSVGFLDACTLS